MSWSKNLQHEKLQEEQAFKYMYTTQYQEKVQTKTITQKPQSHREAC